MHSQPPSHLPTVGSIGTSSFGDAGDGNKQVLWVLPREPFLLMPHWLLTSDATACVHFSIWVFQLLSFPPRGSSSFPQPEFLLLSVLTLALTERVFGIIFPPLSRVYKEMGYFEPPEALCSIVICKLSIQSHPNQQPQAQHL